MQKKQFFKRLIDLEMMNENGEISLRIKGVKDWPVNLDIENWKIDSVSPGEEDDEKGEGYISGYAGGDWQDMTRFTILIPATGKPYCRMFDSPDCIAGKNIYKDLKSLVKDNLKEAQFKTKRRKVARSYEERRKLANRKRFNEYEYINAPENNMELWIVEENNPETFIGYINSLSKEVATHLNIFFQKAGFRCVHSRPTNCEYARSIPARYLLGDKTYIEWSDEKLTEAIQVVKDNLKLKATKVNENPLKTVKAKQFFESRVKSTKKYNSIVEALRAAIASFQSIGVQVQLIENTSLFKSGTLDISYGPYHVFFDTIDDDFENYGKYLITLPLANEPSVQWIGGNENELFADLKDIFNVLDKIMKEPVKAGRDFTN